MSNGESAKDRTDNLITLIVNQDMVITAWIKFLVTIEAALGVSLGFILKIGSGAYEQRFMTVGIYLIPGTGILVALAMSAIVVRERKWQAWYSRQLKKTSKAQQLFPSRKGAVKKERCGFVSWVIIGFTSLICVGWVIVLFALQGK